MAPAARQGKIGVQRVRVKDRPQDLKISLLVFKDVVAGASFTEADRKFALNGGIARARFLQARRVVFSAVGGPLNEKWPPAEQEGHGPADVQPFRCSPSYLCTGRQTSCCAERGITRRKRSWYGKTASCMCTGARNAVIEANSGLVMTLTMAPNRAVQCVARQ